MRTVTCTMTFEDGKCVTAKAAAKSPKERVIFHFSGDLPRMMATPEKGTLDFLEWYLRGCAVNLQGELTVVTEGEYTEGAS